MKIAVVAQGAMGAGTGAALTEGGAEVVTALAGRSAASARRAQAANMKAATDAELVDADMILSIVPPGDALAFALRMAPFLKAATKKPLFVDCNAVSPASVTKIEAVIVATGAEFVDAGIIGGPPRKGVAGPSFYASGGAAKKFAALISHGLDVRVLDAPAGAASGLKMSYGGITKGCTAIGSAMFLAASRSGAAEGLRNELADSQSALTPWFERQVPGMYQKAYRWVAEMREIAEFAGEDAATAALYEAIAQFYQRLAEDEAGPKLEIGALRKFLARKPEPVGGKRKVGYKEMMAKANAAVTTLTPQEAIGLGGRGDVVFIDIRDPRELERDGRMPGAVHCPRGMLEFWIDPESPYARPLFQEDRKFVFFCAGGWRSALAAEVAQRMGLASVAHVGEGFTGWKAAGGAVEESGQPRVRAV